MQADRVEAARTLTSQASQLRDHLGEEPTDDQITALQEALAQAEAVREAAEASRAAAQEQLSTARRTAAEVAQLAALAVPLLSDHCPVCGQGIDRGHVEQQLRERAEATETILELQQALDEKTADHARAMTAAATTRDALATAEQQAGRWRQVRSTELAASTAVAALADDIQVVRFDWQDVEAFVEAAGPVLEYFRHARRSLLDLLETFDRQSDQAPWTAPPQRSAAWRPRSRPRGNSWPPSRRDPRGFRGYPSRRSKLESR